MLSKVLVHELPKHGMKSLAEPERGKLSGAVGYLSGAMEAANDFGHGWRKSFQSKIKKALPEIILLDPTNKPSNLISESKSIGEVFKTIDLNDRQQLNTFIRYAKRIRRDDLRMCDLSDFMIVRIDKKIPACGTFDELFTIEDQQKPIFAIVEGGLSGLPGWLFAVLNPYEVFATEEECIAHLVKLNNGEIALDDRWVLIRNHLNTQELINAR